MRIIFSRIETKLFLSIWLVYAVYATPAGGVTPNRYVDLVHSIVNESRFEIDTYHENTIDKAYYNGHYYAGALPGPSFVAVPMYVVFKGIYSLIPEAVKQMASGVQSYKVQKLPESNFYQRVDNVEFFLSHGFLVVTLIALLSALCNLLLFKTVHTLGYSDLIALLVAISYAFGTIVFFYSTLFFEQIFSAVLVIGSFYLILKMLREPDQNKHTAGILLAGLLAGSGFLVEYTTVFIAFWLGVYLLFSASRRSAVLYGIGCAIPLLALANYNAILFGNPLTTPYAYLVKIPEHEAVHGVGLLGITSPRADRLASLLLGEEGGLFIFAPNALLGVLGLSYHAFKKKPFFLIAWIFLAMVITYIAFFISFVNWRGGSAFGPRYLITALPFISIGIAFAFDFIPAGLIYAIGFFSIFINWLGAQFGFAESIFQPFQTMMSQGPTLPMLDAILTHSSNKTSALYLFALNYHVPITLALTAGLAAVMLLLWRDAKISKLDSND